MAFVVRKNFEVKGSYACRFATKNIITLSGAFRIDEDQFKICMAVKDSDLAVPNA
jgi:hypothetical protein